MARKAQMIDTVRARRGSGGVPECVDPFKRHIVTPYGTIACGSLLRKVQRTITTVTRTQFIRRGIKPVCPNCRRILMDGCLDRELAKEA
jgi:hypothetical protein